MPSSSNKTDQQNSSPNKKRIKTSRINDRNATHMEGHSEGTKVSSLVTQSTLPYPHMTYSANGPRSLSQQSHTSGSLSTTPFVSPLQGSYHHNPTHSKQSPVTQQDIYNILRSGRMRSQSNTSSGEMSMSSYPMSGSASKTPEHVPIAHLPSSRRLPPGYSLGNYTQELSTLTLPTSRGSRLPHTGDNTIDYPLNIQQRPFLHNVSKNNTFSNHAQSLSQIPILSSPVRGSITSSSKPMSFRDSPLGTVRTGNHPLWFAQAYCSGTNSNRDSIDRSASSSVHNKSFMSTSSTRSPQLHLHTPPQSDTLIPSATNMSLNNFKASHHNIEGMTTKEDLDPCSIMNKRAASTGSQQNYHSHKQTPSPPASMEHRNKQRTKQLTFGRVTTGYRNYRMLVPTFERQIGNEHHPITPRVSEDCSKRKWDAIVASWRRALHKWDHICCNKDADDLRIKRKLLEDGSFEKDDEGNIIGITMGELGLIEIEDRTTFFNRTKKELDILRSKVKERRERDSTDESGSANGANRRDSGKNATTCHSVASQRSSSPSLDNVHRNENVKDKCDFSRLNSSDLAHTMKYSTPTSASVDDIGVIGSGVYRRNNTGRNKEHSSNNAFSPVADQTTNEYIFVPSSGMANYDTQRFDLPIDCNIPRVSEGDWRRSNSDVYSAFGETKSLTAPIEDHVEEVHQNVVSWQTEISAEQPYVATEFSQRQQHCDPQSFRLQSNSSGKHSLSSHTTRIAEVERNSFKSSSPVRALDASSQQRTTPEELVNHCNRCCALLMKRVAIGGNLNCLSIFSINIAQYSIDDVKNYFQQQYRPQGINPPMLLPPVFLPIVEPTGAGTNYELPYNIATTSTDFGDTNIYNTIIDESPCIHAQTAGTTLLSENVNSVHYIVNRLLERLQSIYDIHRLYWIQQRVLKKDYYSTNIISLSDPSAFSEFSNELLTQVRKAIDVEDYSSSVSSSCPIIYSDVTFPQAEGTVHNLSAASSKSDTTICSSHGHPMPTAGSQYSYTPFTVVPSHFALRSPLDVSAVHFPCLIYAVYDNVCNPEQYGYQSFSPMNLELGATCTMGSLTREAAQTRCSHIEDRQVLPQNTQSRPIGSMPSNKIIRKQRGIQSNNTATSASMGTIDSLEMEGGFEGDDIAYNCETCDGRGLRSSIIESATASLTLGESVDSENVSHVSPNFYSPNFYSPHNGSSTTDYSLGIDIFSRVSPIFYVDPMRLMNDHVEYNMSNMNNSSEEMERLYMMGSQDSHIGHIGSAALLGTPPPTPCGGDERSQVSKTSPTQ